MYVRDHMSRGVATIDQQATISDAISLMNDTGYHRIPVMRKDKLVGLITDGSIQKATPSQATSLSIYEINYLLSNSTVADYMTHPIVTVASDQLIEEAVRLMRNKKISCLPVVDDGKLVGMITENDVFDAFISLLGFMEVGTRISIDIEEDKIGVISNITTTIRDNGASITHMHVYHNADGTKNVVIRLATLESDAIVAALKQAGYQLRMVSKNPA